MGITIHYRFARKATPETLMQEIEDRLTMMGLAKSIKKRSWNRLEFCPHPKSEWVSLHWHKWKTVKNRKKDWDYDRETLKEFSEVLDDNDWVCSGFTKTQYAGTEAHVIVAEFLRHVARKCRLAEVSDEADYYETGFSEEAVNKLKSTFDDWNKFIGHTAEAIKKAFGPENVIVGGEI